MEVVLDVNVFVSAVLSGAGPSAALVAAMRDGRLSAVASSRLLIERVTYFGVIAFARTSRTRRWMSTSSSSRAVPDRRRPTCRPGGRAGP